MSHRLSRSAVAPLVAAACVLGAVAFAPRADARIPLFTPGAFSHVMKAKADDNSLNWAGYYVPAKGGEKITEVSGTTYAPKMKLLPPTQAASWVGVGGANSNDLIQAGVAFGQLDGYYAWFERLPESIQPITSGCVGDNACTVVAGDRIDMRIRHLGGDQWNMALVNVGKWSWSMDTAYKSSFSSAEWIYEAPSYFGLVYTPPANVPHARFFSNRYVVNGQAKALRQSDATRTHFSPIGIVRGSTTSNVRGDSAFKVCPYKQSCPTP